jgi:hypothetical protein
MNEFSRDRDPAFGDELVAKKPVLVAVDLGAESCRVSLLRWIQGQPVSEAALRRGRRKQEHTAKPTYRKSHRTRSATGISRKHDSW